MKFLILTEKMYQGITSGALAIVFVAAILADKCPEVRWVCHLITAIMTGVVILVYLTSVISRRS
jgi:hypothetical protein